MSQVKGSWLASAPAQAVCALLEEAGHEAWFVGGCVRNALMGAHVTDIDISTDARPQVVMALAQARGIKAVPTGIDHGTVTLVLSGTPFEVTTFRRDIETDGRHATVRFAESLEEDAARRDFTVNALYADRAGSVRDPVGGLSDLPDRRFRFIGSATARIREDYLRILRFFRFFAWYGDTLDEEGLAACAAGADGLARLSVERVTAEMIKLLSAPDPARAVASMAQAGVLARILPGAEARWLGPFVAHEAEGLRDPMARLAALGGSHDALRLSKADARRLGFFAGSISSDAQAGELGYRHGRALALNALALRAAMMERAPQPDELFRAETGAKAQFPLSASDLPDALQGAEIGAALRRLEAVWIARQFAPTKTELLEEL
ncbi:MAG: CCA tRNA nucleotidyltransferase [Pseudomonadota bacterium]